MRMTSRKKEILSYFEPDSLDWVTGEIGAPPFDVSGVAYLLHGMGSFDKRHQLESTRRTLESMVAGGLLERVTVYESRQVQPVTVSTSLEPFPALNPSANLHICKFWHVRTPVKPAHSVMGTKLLHPKTTTLVPRKAVYQTGYNLVYNIIMHSGASL